MTEKCKDEKHCPKNVNEDVCNARMATLETKLKYLFGSSMVTILLLVIEILLKVRT